jgi:pimeloyl-ACP methyl ester carboxylesterase
MDMRSRMVLAAGLTFMSTGCPDGDPSEAASTAASTGSSGATQSSDMTQADAAGSTNAASSAGHGSGSTDDTTAGANTLGSSGAPDEPGPDLRELGPYAVELDNGTAALDGCSMGYDLRTPAGVPDAPAVVLAHGFQGNRASMVGWAEHWASWGVRVVTPDLCHATIVDTDHAQNGADLRALVGELSLPSVIYAGYSAGGLATVLAAADDPLATALLGLDMVDSGGLGAGAAAAVGVPAFDIVGEPSQCNTTNNGIAVFGSITGARALRVTEADHCDFQSPADFLCGLTCTGSNDQFDDAAIAAAVLGLSTAVVLWQSELEPTGAQWWTPGEHYYDLLIGVGIVQEP